MDGTDPHQTFTPNRNAQLHAWETPLIQDAALRPRPQPAATWRAVGPVSSDFKHQRD